MITDETIQSITASIQAIESSLSEDVIKQILKRLDSFGYVATVEDAFLIVFSLQKVKQDILNQCNVSEVPDGLHYALVDQTTGLVLQSKNAVGQLEISSLDLSGIVQSVKVGDASVSYSGSSDTEKFNGLLNYLLSSGKDDYTCYRKFKW